MTVHTRRDFIDKYGVFTFERSMRETNKEENKWSVFNRKGGYCWRPTGIWAEIYINTELLSVEKLKLTVNNLKKIS